MCRTRVWKSTPHQFSTSVADQGIIGVPYIIMKGNLPLMLRLPCIRHFSLCRLYYNYHFVQNSVYINQLNYFLFIADNIWDLFIIVCDSYRGCPFVAIYAGYIGNRILSLANLEFTHSLSLTRWALISFLESIK